MFCIRVLFQGCLSLSAVKSAFQETGHKLSSRDCKAMAVSALTGLVLCDVVGSIRNDVKYKLLCRYKFHYLRQGRSYVTTPLYVCLPAGRISPQLYVVLLI